MNKRKVGYKGEELAVGFLKEQNILIKDRNFYSRYGELDIVGRDGEYLVFFEVKYRESENCGSPLEAITGTKIKRIVRAARFYMLRYGYGEDTFVRFDVIAITKDRIEWIKNAFECS